MSDPKPPSTPLGIGGSTILDRDRQAELNSLAINAVYAVCIKPAVVFTIDRINAMLRAEGMPPCEDFTRSIPGISREAQACGALERKHRLSGLDLEHVRFWMKDGRRVKMLLGERVNALQYVHDEPARLRADYENEEWESHDEEA